MSITDYAGFWLRLVALVIDSIVLSVVYLLLIIPLVDAFWPMARHPPMEDAAFGRPDYVFTGIGQFFPQIDFSQLILLAIAFVYYSLMESSRYQASLGKLALELKVTNVQGGRLNVGRSLLRNVSKILSAAPLFAGYVAAAVTPKKQAWHDVIADALVIKK